MSLAEATGASPNVPMAVLVAELTTTPVRVALTKFGAVAMTLVVPVGTLVIENEPSSRDVALRSPAVTVAPDSAA